MTISVIIPTYRRPQDLRRCLRALAAQQRPADQILVILRPDDRDSWPVLAEAGMPAVCRVPVATPGQVAALNAGLRRAGGDIVAITDDDAAPRPDWLQRIEAHFAADASLAGVGGRDWVHHGAQPAAGQAATVGKVQWFGRVIGNHHLGAGPPRPVDTLKGANMAFRRAVLAEVRFDLRLRGRGAQVHNDRAVCLAIGRRGGRLLYDPAVAVDHYPAPRYDADSREGFSSEAQADAAHNDTLVMLDHLSASRRLAFAAWAILVGTRCDPGIIQAVRLAPSQGRLALHRWAATLRGRLAGLRTWRGTDHSCGRPRFLGGTQPCRP